MTSSSKRLASLLAAAGLCLTMAALGTGCHRHHKLVQVAADASTSDEALYRLGEAELKNDTEKGLIYLRQLIDTFPKSFYAQRAKLLIADSYFKGKDETNMVMAASEYGEFIRTYPYSPSAAYCQYQIAMTYYRKMLAPGRDQSKTRQALLEFQKVLSDYPASSQAKDAQDKIKECETQLSLHYYQIARTYHKQKAYRASINRFLEIMAQYPDFPKMDELYYYLADCYFMVRRYEEARPFFQKLLSDFPKSQMIKATHKRLKALDLAEAAAPRKPQSKTSSK